MKNLSLGLNVVLFVGLGVLYFLHFNTNSSTTNNTVSDEIVASQLGDISIAYVNIDSVLLQYDLSIELNESITKKQANMKSKLEKEAQAFEKDAQIFQDKLQRGIFLTQERAQEAQQQLVARQQELQKLEYDYTNQLAAEQQQMNAQLFDSISSYITEYNTPEKYKVIFGHSIGGSLLYGSVQLDITDKIVGGLNNRYGIEE